jgi:preprotein translocase subunit YajC
MAKVRKTSKVETMAGVIGTISTVTTENSVTIYTPVSMVSQETGNMLHSDGQSQNQV